MPLLPADIVRAKRRLLDMHHRSRVGHLGGNLSALDAMMLVHHDLMRPDDRFVLSKGHSAGAYYIVLWSLGLIPDAELASFHQDDTRLAGHPPAFAIPDIRFSTGSLGHGLPLAAGMALAARLQGSLRQVFCLTSDGEWQEGSTIEALVFACHRRLSNLTILVDHNGLQGFGSTADVASMDPLDKLIGGCDVDIRHCDGHDLAAMRATLAPRGNRPVVALLHTVKGHGVPDFAGRMDSHYLPLTEAQYRGALDRLEALA